jgi:hypothetical protein
LTGKRRMFVIEIRRDGDEWRGRLRDNDADEVRADTRELVVRSLELMALAQVQHDLRRPGSPLVKEVVFEIVEAEDLPPGVAAD